MKHKLHQLQHHDGKRAQRGNTVHLYSGFLGAGDDIIRFWKWSRAKKKS
jgi:hypothetical protein